MKKATLHVLWVAAAVLLVAAGIVFLCNVNTSLAGIAVWIGLAMVLSGLLQVGVNYLMHDTVFGDHGFLIKAVLTIVVGVFVLCNSFIAGDVLNFLISMMILVDGVSVVGVAFAMNRDRIFGRGWLWLIGILEIALGVLGFLKPEIINVSIGIIAGISLIYEGLTLFYTWFIGMKWRKLMKL